MYFDCHSNSSLIPNLLTFNFWCLKTSVVLISMLWTAKLTAFDDKILVRNLLRLVLCPKILLNSQWRWFLIHFFNEELMLKAVSYHVAGNSLFSCRSRNWELEIYVQIWSPAPSIPSAWNFVCFSLGGCVALKAWTRPSAIVLGPGRVKLQS